MKVFLLLSENILHILLTIQKIPVISPYQLTINQKKSAMQNWNRISPAQITREKNGTDMSVFNSGSRFVATVYDFRLITLLDMEELKAEKICKTQKLAIEFCEALALEIEAAE